MLISTRLISLRCGFYLSLNNVFPFTNQDIPNAKRDIDSNISTGYNFEI